MLQVESETQSQKYWCLKAHLTEGCSSADRSGRKERTEFGRRAERCSEPCPGAGQLGQRAVLQGVGTMRPCRSPALAAWWLSGRKQPRRIFSTLCSLSAREPSGLAMAWVPAGFLFRELAFPIFWGYPSPPSWLLWGRGPCE